MDTALPQKIPFILDRNLAEANCTENHVCTSCDTVVLGSSKQIWLFPGAKTLYKSLSPDCELRRFTLHKSAPQHGVLHYVLLCDCSNFLTNISCAIKAVPKLRMRLCGDIGLYRPIATL